METHSTIFPLFSFIISFAALVGYINNRLLRLPTTIAIMSGSLLLSLCIIIVGQYGFHDIEQRIYHELIKLDFHDILMQGMLSFLLFAGALNVNINHLRQSKWEIATLATFSTLASTLIIALMCYILLPFLGLSLPFIYCLLFGALISPTDPIAVLAIFKEVRAPQKLDITVSGESLFNDGVGIVLFLTLYQLAFQDTNPTLANVSLLFLREALGGIIFGVILGVIGHWLIISVDSVKVPLLITLAMTTGGYCLANSIGISGPLAMVAAGIFVGNKGKSFSVNKQTRTTLYHFWEMIDEILNAILFFLIGIELLLISHNQTSVAAGFMAIPLVLLVRFVTVAAPLSLFKLKRSYPPHFIKILVWGGLRGGLAVALALSLPLNQYRDLILTMTYSVVIFSVIVQGLTVKPMVEASKK